ncbi:MAG: signal recognition particle-docking protein FtsY [Hyphomicrobiaceae bacterium]
MNAPVEKKRGLFGRLFSGGSDPAPAAAPTPESREAVADAHTIASEAAAQAADAVTMDEVIEERPTTEATAPGAPAAKQGWFSRLKAGLTKSSSKLSEGITGLFTKSRLNVDTLDDLEELLIQADLGVETATRISKTLSQGRFAKGISPEDVRAVLADEVERVLTPVAKPLVIDSAHKPHVVLVVGVNGAGKTTTIGKLAQQFGRSGKSVMMAAGDTFRAAAIDQLRIWGDRTGAPVISRKVGSDSAGLAFDALNAAREAGTDVLLIDTAGRLQNKAALMDELEKVVRVLRKIDPSAPHTVLLVLDATTGQNALSQVEVFRDRAGVTGLVMTKLDGSARGGILVAISARFGLPVHAIGVGETAEDLQPFDPKEFARAIALG